MLRLWWGALVLLVWAPAAGAQGWTDAFDGGALHKRWRWRTPVSGPTFSLTDRPGWLRVRLPERPGGFGLRAAPAAVDEAPQLWTGAPAGDWELEARLQLPQVAPDSRFQAGLMVGTGDSPLLTFGPVQDPGTPGGASAPEVRLEPAGVRGYCRTPGEARDVRLLLARTGCVCRARVARGTEGWVDVGLCLLPQGPCVVGLVGRTFGGRSPLTFDVDTVRFTPLKPPGPAGRRALAGVGGEYPTGYRGLLARLGLPHEVLLDHQLADPEALRRYEILLIGGMGVGARANVADSLMRYVREGGIALLDSRAFPPPSVLPGRAYTFHPIPDFAIVGTGNPLAPLLGAKTRFPGGESWFQFEPSDAARVQVLARFEHGVGQPKPSRPPDRPDGPPAIWAMSLGKGLLLYSSPAIGATLSWGFLHDALAEALLQCVGMGRLEPQLEPEGARFGRKQSALTEQGACEASHATSVPDEVRAFVRPRLSVPAGPLPAGARRIEERGAAEFNLTGTFHPKRGRGVLLLNYRSPRYLVRVSFEAGRARVVRVANGTITHSAEVPLTPGMSVPFVVKERRDRIALTVGGRSASIPAGRLWDGRLAVAGPGIGETRYQPVEPAWMDDDFTRAEGDQGSWEVVSGKWSLRSVADPKMGANPFTYLGQAKGPAMAAAGWPFWDEYVFSVSVRPIAAATVGVAIYYEDARSYLLFRSRVVATPAEARGGMEVVRVAEGKETVLARRDGGLAKGHWYRLSFQARDGALSAAVDGERVASCKDNTFLGGAVALYVLDGQAEFDDAWVRPVAVASAPSSVVLDGDVPGFAGTLDRDTWAGTALQWQADPGAAGLFWRRGRIYGDFSLTFRCRFGRTGSAPAARAEAGPAIHLLLAAGEAAEAADTYALSLQPAARAASGAVSSRSFVLQMRARGAPARPAMAVAASAEPVLELRRSGARLLGLLDGRPILECRLSAPAGKRSRLGLRAVGFRPRLSLLRLRAAQVLDYCFNSAPVDWWVASGTWELAARWPCTPEWSWYAGESRQVAAIWHKRRFAGDVLLDLHVGPRTVTHSDGTTREICRAFNAVLCGDGQDVRSGYSFVVGADRNGAGATLSRNGRVVARNDAYRVFSDAHNQWLNVRAEKHGATVALWVADQKLLSWTDPEPLPGGRLAIWTEDNAIMIPRATIYYR